MVPDCAVKHHARGMCQKHLARFVKHGSVYYLERPRRYEGVCVVPGCGQPHRARGLCGLHYNQKRRFNDWSNVATAFDTWADVDEWVETWRELRHAQSGARWGDPDAPMVELGRAAVRAGWPPELAVDFVPKLYANWPERAGDSTHEQHLSYPGGPGAHRLRTEPARLMPER